LSASSACDPGCAQPPRPVPDELWAEFVRSRDPATRDRLIARYMPLAGTLAARLFRVRVDDSVLFGDYLQYAHVGLIEAVDRYDPLREASFETFSAYRIRGAILNGLGKESEMAAQRDYWRTHAQERVSSLKPEAMRSGGSADLDDLVQLTVGLAIGVLLEGPDEADPEDPSVRANPYAGAELAELKRIARGAVGRLPEREREIIGRHYFGQCEFQMVAAEMGITKGRVSQLHAQALARIRKTLGLDGNLDLNL
jgi:RNA polymerase sigma factor for flagellar operon FliA